MKKAIFLILLALFIFGSGELRAQHEALNSTQTSDWKKAHFISFKTQFFQIKDGFNYGLAHSGLNLAAGYSFEKTSEKRSFSYAADLAFGANFNKGVGLAWHLKPVEFFYGYRVNKSESWPVILGPYFSTNYHWQLYPELQSGHMFWFTALEVGPRVILSKAHKNRTFLLRFSNSFAGLTSRPEPATESYFYSLGLGDFIENAHSDLKFGFNDLLNHSILEIEMLPKPGKRLSLAYEFEHFQYHKNPKWSYITHSFNLKWKIGKK